MTKTDITMNRLLEAYLIENLVRPATAETYTKVVKRWSEETKIERPDAISREDVLLWRNGILSRARAETWNKYRRHMRALQNYAMARGWAGSNPFKEVPPARTGHRLKKTVHTDLLRKALEWLDQEPNEEDPRKRLQPTWFWAMVLRAFYFTGVRRRQLIELRWSDVDLVAGTWHIRAETSKTHREWLVPLAPEVIEDLTELERKTREHLGGHKPAGHYQVFNVTLFYKRYRGPRMNEGQLGGFFHRLSEALGERVTPHRLRHTMATLLAAHGDIKTLQDLLGHTNLSTTMGYVHPDVERMRSLVTRLPEL